MKRLSALTLVLAFLSVVFFLLLIFLRIPFPLYPLMSYQDAFDLLTPLVLLPIYWLLYRQVTCNRGTQTSELAFMVFAGFWAAGQGMHLSANSVDNLIGNLAKQAAVDVTGTQIFTLTYFYDEYLSHYLWHIGVIGLGALLIYESWRRPGDEPTDWRLITPAAVLYGFLLFCIFLEGNTLPIGLPFVALVTLVVLVAGRKKLGRQPVVAFFFASCALALVMIAGWWLYWGCLPPILEPYHCQAWRCRLASPAAALSDWIIFIVFNLNDFARCPLNIEQGAIRALLSWLIPYGFVPFHPAGYLLGRTTGLMAWLSPVGAAVFLLIAYLVWLFGLRNYDSTGS